jgi:antibiotic biosynthesis monooxygenase (ABM) superfamily enzyme
VCGQVVARAGAGISPDNAVQERQMRVLGGSSSAGTLPVGLPASRTARTKRPAPPKWKRALLAWVGLLPQGLVLPFVLEPLRLPFVLAAALSSALAIAMLTWVVMPSLTWLFHGWLHAGVDSRGSSI